MGTRLGVLLSSLAVIAVSALSVVVSAHVQDRLAPRTETCTLGVNTYDGTSDWYCGDTPVVPFGVHLTGVQTTRRLP